MKTENFTEEDAKNIKDRLLHIVCTGSSENQAVVMQALCYISDLEEDLKFTLDRHYTT